MKSHHTYFLRVAASSIGVLVSASAYAASLQEVAQSEWSGTGLPSYVNMYIYVPDNLAAKPPIVVGLHHCQGNGPGTYSEMSSLVAKANSTGFIMIFPEATGQNCWDAGSPRSLQHEGGGDTQAVVQMVRYTLAKYGADPQRVYAVGSSSGGIMTEALLGVYPDVFMAGVSLMGVPCGCWSQSYNDITGTGNTAQWSGPCAGGNVTKTAQQWGDLVRSYFPGYTGHRPRLQHWHGTADTTLNYKNLAEDVKEWTNLLGLSESPQATDTPQSGTTHQSWKDGCNYTVYETFSLAGIAHAVPFDGNAVSTYFGLDTAGGQDPETAACPGAVPGGSNSAGNGGAAGMGGASGHANGGSGAIGGAGGASGGGVGGFAASTGGVSGAAGRSGDGASAGGGGNRGPASIDNAGRDGGGTLPLGGAAANSGAGGITTGNGGSATFPAGASDISTPRSKGCNCAIGTRPTSPRAAPMLFIAALWMLLRRVRLRLCRRGKQRAAGPRGRRLHLFHVNH